MFPFPNCIADSASRSFQCSCGRTFRRKYAHLWLERPAASLMKPNRDSLKRHSSSCRISLSSTVTISEPRKGKKGTACDRCFRLKKACSTGLPCATCKARDKDCSYYRCLSLCEEYSESIQQSPSEILPAVMTESSQDVVSIQQQDLALIGIEFWLPTSGFESEDMFSCGIDRPLNWSDTKHTPSSDLVDLNTFLSIPGQFPSYNIPFLQTDYKLNQKLNYLMRVTSSHGLANSFECGTNDQREALNFDPSSYDCEQGYPPLLTFPMAPQSYLFHGELSSGRDLFPDPLTMRSIELVNILKEVCSRKSEENSIDISWSPFIEDSCFRFFAPHNLRRFLHLFWTLWYPNCPIIHKPSFNTKAISGMLFITMTLFGACLSPRKTENDFARLLLNCVEEAVFAKSSMSPDSIPGNLGSANRSVVDRSRIQSLQAMYLVCVLQNWEGTNGAKRRIRRYRYMTVITVSFCVLSYLIASLTSR